MSAARLASALVLFPVIAALALSSCIGVIGLNGYEDAVVRLCRCDVQLAFLADCEAVLSARLGGVSATTRAAWLAYFAEHCSNNCAAAYDCYAQSGTCSSVGCAVAEDCCGFASGADCTGGVCQIP